MRENRWSFPDVPPIPITKALPIRKGEVVALVGSGGKTTLLFQIARELVAAGRKVITTTTTRIRPPTEENPSAQLFLLEGRPPDDLPLPPLLDEHRHITIGERILGNGKLKGLSPQQAGELGRIVPNATVVVEADGCRHCSLKAFADHEPVFPSGTRWVVAVVGIDALGRPLDHETVYQAELAAERLNVPIGTTIDSLLIARLITHPFGYFKQSHGRRTALVINKVNNQDSLRALDPIVREVVACHPWAWVLARGDLWENGRVVPLVKGRAQRKRAVVSSGDPSRGSRK